MRQSVMTSPGHIELHEIESPVVGERDILLRIQRIGICGSDIHVYHGKHPFTQYPVVQGHEYCGSVAQVGSQISGVRVGMKATARPQLVCGKCKPCLRGDYNVCQFLRVQGFQAPGCAQDYFVTVPERIVLLPDHFSFEQGAFVEPFAVGAHSTAKAGPLKGRNVVVFGAGTIGNIVAQFCRARGASGLLITDISDYRLEIAQKSGIKNVSNTARESFETAVNRVFAAEGFQVAIDCSGAQAALTAAVDNIQKGGRIVIVGVFSQPPVIHMAKICEHEITLLGSMMYKHEDYLEAVEMIAAGRVITEPLVTKHFKLEDYQQAYEYIESQADKTMKVMIDL